MLRDLLIDNNRGGVTEEDASDENDAEEDATTDENDTAEENVTAENSPEDSEAEFSEQDDDDDDEEYEAEDFEQFQTVKKAGPPPRDKSKDATKMEVRTGLIHLGSLASLSLLTLRSSRFVPH
jgi:hypothetical protein